MRPFLLTAAALLPSASIAKVLPLRPGNGSSAPVATFTPLSNTTLNSPMLSLPALDLSSTGATNIHCSGEEFGKNLRYNSCLDALTEIPEDGDPKTVGFRDMGDFDIPLPHRFISGKVHSWTLGSSRLHCLRYSAEDGFCIFDIMIPNMVLIDRISLRELRSAGRELLNRCVLGPGLLDGGLATNLGTFDLSLYQKLCPLYLILDRALWIP